MSDKFCPRGIAGFCRIALVRGWCDDEEGEHGMRSCKIADGLDSKEEGLRVLEIERAKKIAAQRKAASPH